MTRLLIPLWLTFVAAISLMPLRFKFRLGTTGVFHNPGHFLVFFATSLLLCRTARALNTRLLCWLSVCLFAVGLEILEWMLYHNSFEWRDVLIDALGAGLGLFAVTLFSLRIPRKVAAQPQNVS